MSRPHLRRPALLTALLVGASMLAAVPVAPVALATPGCKVKNVRTSGTATVLADAAALATAGDTLEIRGTCIGPTTIDRNLKLVGKPSTTLGKPILDGLAVGRVLFITSGTKVSISNLTIRNGVAATADTPSGRGGGIYNEGTLTLTGVKVRDNAADDRGAGIYTTGALTLAKGTQVFGNSGKYGAGVFVGGETTTASLTMTGNATVRDNEVTNDGGGIYAITGAVTLRGTASVRGNHADISGGGIELIGATLDLFDSASVTANSASYGSGGIEGLVQSGRFARVRMHDTSVVAENSAIEYASGIGMEGTVLMEDAAVVRDNSVANGRGAVELWTYNHDFDAKLTMKGDSRIRGNTAGVGGSGIFLYDGCGGDAPTVVGATAKRVLNNTPATRIVRSAGC